MSSLNQEMLQVRSSDLLPLWDDESLAEPLKDVVFSMAVNNMEQLVNHQSIKLGYNKSDFLFFTHIVIM